ncbi:MAG: hypothetical protein SWH78_05615 [Thermodesulfobacteriota bacterium]|nr:hypothetical protein [Thermodesulfobacteriota bacterium]
MIELDALTGQVLKNCDISDSEHAGVYSVCGLALRLRDLYKWTKGLPPWEEKEAAEILAWIGDKEELWDGLTEKDFIPLSLLGQEYDPFDTSGINSVLEPEGLLYGAGYARSLKPTFFLAHIDDKQQVDGHPVYTLGRELARDLFTIPALTQDDCVIVRRQSATLFLWDQIIYIKESGRHALRFAMENCGLKEGDPKELQQGLATIFDAQRETYIYHEIGELRDTVFDRDLWREVIAAYPHTPVELLARAVKDLLADTNDAGALAHIIREGKEASLGFYVAFIDGLAKENFPELRVAFQEFTETGNWQVIEQAVSHGHHRARKQAAFIMETYLKGKEKNEKEWAKAEIENRLIKRK